MGVWCSGNGTATRSVLVLVVCNGVLTYRIPGGTQSRKGAGRLERPVFRVCTVFSCRVTSTTDSHQVVDTIERVSEKELLSSLGVREREAPV